MPMLTRKIITYFLVLLACVACSPTTPPEEPGHPYPEQPAPAPPPEGVTRHWSDDDAWPAGQPVKGADVVIAAGEVVLLDTSPPPLGTLRVEGALVFADIDLELSAASIIVHGALHIGSPEAPHAHRATITLTGERKPGTETGMGDRVLGTMHAGRIEMHGLSDPSWTRLAADAMAGAGSITVADARGWRQGDRIVIATTDFTMRDEGGTVADLQTEERRIVAIDGNRLELDTPLDFFHVGELMSISGIAVDQRAEVARLSRNIVVQGPASSLDREAADHGFGGHVMIMPGGAGRFTGVEFRRMGQRGILARYPVHYHLMRDSGAGSFVRHVAIHQSFNRCVTVHGTRHVRVHDVVGYGAPGHCFFLEDGAETGNSLTRNLALDTREPEPGYAILTSDRGYHGPAGFWITNPDNVIVGNHAVASAGTGFWYALPARPTGQYHDAFGDSEGIRPRTTALGEFRDNTAHSNASIGLHVDNGPTGDLSGTPPTNYTPRADPEDADSAPVTAVFENLTAWRNRDAGAWFRGDHTVLRGGLLSDNAIGVTFASEASYAEGVTFVGETPNRGTPRGWEDTGADGRTLPRPWDPGFLIRGFEFYDGDVGIADSTFAAYVPNAQRRAAGISYKDFTAFPVSPRNWASGLDFAPGTLALWLETRTPEPEYPADGYRSALFIDRDGSLGGAPGSVLSVSNPFLLTGACQRRDDFNAFECSGDYASLTLEVVGGSPVPFGTVTITREDGVDHLMAGTPNAASYRTILPAGGRYAYEFSGSAPHVRLNYREAAAMERVIVSLPWPHAGASIYRDWYVSETNRLPAYSSPEALEAAAGAGYHLSGGRLYVSLIEQNGRGYAQLEICRTAGC